VATLTDYVAPESLQRLQDEFVSALGLPLRVCAESGEPLVAESPPGAAPAEAPDERAGAAASAFGVPILLEGQLLGRIG